MTIQAPTNGIYRHKCIETSCSEFVMYDDEPWCFDHSPDEGSSLVGYSAYQHDLLNYNYLQNLLKEKAQYESY